MKFCYFIPLSLSILSGCGGRGMVPSAGAGVSLAEARRGFETKLVRKEAANHPVDDPPPDSFRAVRYDAPAGKLFAYLSPDPGDGRKHPAIVWITGGDCNTIDGAIWAEPDPSNEQTASAYRKAGIIMMFPSLRGGSDNPGIKESFLGEVDDVLAAADYLVKQDYVDPARIYLGGHSTGGTLVLLVAESTDRFRAVFSFGPVDDVSGYPPVFLPFDTGDRREVELRSPRYWLPSIRCPTFVFEGTASPGNFDALRTMQRLSKNPLAHFFAVMGATHFTILGPTNQAIASKILRDDGAKMNIHFSEEELDRPFAR